MYEAYNVIQGHLSMRNETFGIKRTQKCSFKRRCGFSKM